MKLIVSGASGFVGEEVVRQALADSRITSLIAISRSSITPPENEDKKADLAKFRNVIVKDYGSYPDEAKSEFEGVDAVIWTVGVTPRNQRGKTAEEIRRVCVDCALAGLEATNSASAQSKGSAEGKPHLRFTYMSGVGAERDQEKTPSVPYWMREYALMRGQAENAVLDFPASHPGVKCQIAKPGAITAAGQYFKIAMSYVLNWTTGLPSLDVTECAAAMIEEAVEGYTTETLLHQDLMRIGKETLGRKKDGQQKEGAE